ncbi:teratocarcinoma-derived growth factor 1 [Melanotaenia boesemani]|uniref:teratocarcinoma-derived growth factor 1 n=1 Tax=Melanotaenia boesemani TaxID=1250792 RepID=UPI001C0478D9|nr:teratocarcinoma-derived growth factor 1 [Melanotaenia boesemani]
MAGTQMFRMVLWAVIWLQTASSPPASDNCEEKERISSQPPSSSLSSSSASPSSSPHVVESPPPSQDFLGQFTQVSSSNSGERKHRHASAVLPFIGLTNSAEQSRSCCKNGGTCILGSFCACPRFFTGRSCEYDTRLRNCDFIPHGEWVQKGCSYCRCGYGMLHCFPHVFQKDCDDSDVEVRWYRSSAGGMIPAGCFLFLLLLLLFFL